MVMTYPYRVKYDGKYYAPGDPVEVVEVTGSEEKKPENQEDTTRRTPKK